MEGYEQYTEAPSGNDLAALSRLADDLADAEERVAQLEAKLKIAQAQVMDIAERQIPEVMDNLGVRSFTTQNGYKVEVQKKIRASIPAGNKDSAYNWLDENGHGGLIKRSISVAFNREQEKTARELQAQLSDQFENVKEDRKVEPSTLTAFIREQLEVGASIPLDLFGAWEQRVARISRTDK
jgi:hypothetical protein